MLSIIIPVYNTEKYLKRCIDSILAQTYTDFELILVDDGSKDQSSLICDKYASNDARVLVIHKNNGGVSSARNSGLDMCKGEYVMFIDSDDWINTDFCERLMSEVEQVDLAISGYTLVSKNEKSENKSKELMMCFPEQMGAHFDELYIKNYLNAPFSKVYKRKLIARQRFDISTMLGEDFLFNLEYLAKCSKIKIYDGAGYYYNCLNMEAATKKLRENDIEQVVYLYKAGQDFLHTYCPDVPESKALNMRLCMNGVNLIQLICYSDSPRCKKKELVERMLKSDDFIRACQYEYALPLKYDIPRKFCSKGNWIALQIFFLLKRTLNNLKKG